MSEHFKYLEPLDPYKTMAIKWCHWEYVLMEKEPGTGITVGRISCVERQTQVSAFIDAVGLTVEMVKWSLT